MQLRNEISCIKEQYASLQDTEREKAIMQSPVINVIRTKLPPSYAGDPISEESWQELLLLVEQCMPNFYARITTGNVLSPDELRLAVLTRLRFSPGDIILIMDKSRVRISNLRLQVNKKLFSDNSARTLAHNIMQLS